MRLCSAFIFRDVKIAKNENEQTMSHYLFQLHIIHWRFPDIAVIHPIKYTNNVLIIYTIEGSDF